MFDRQFYMIIIWDLEGGSMPRKREGININMSKFSMLLKQIENSKY